MTVHRFTVNIPNPETRRVPVRLRLQRLAPRAVAALGLELPQVALEVASAAISLDPCATEGKAELDLRVAGNSSQDVYVVIATAAPDPKRGGAAAFHLIDERDGKVAGGVTLACVERVGPYPDGQHITPPNPCPIALAADPYPLAPHGNPAKPTPAKTIPAGVVVQLVVPITNPRRRTVSAVQVYLEHLGSSDATFAPATWNVGDLAPDAVFYATWVVSTGGGSLGSFSASVVVASKGTDPVRLNARLRLGARAEPGPESPRRRVRGAKSTGRQRSAK
jgi:hypothetical protein